ncbi:MAG: hypothetical protein QOG72_2803 [Sphingomonadales bacterium]|jgi:hypothetical protein|nr:hypothetical protein [Sphingomonadales bacterium]
MAKSNLAALLALAAVSVQAEAGPIQPSPDSAKERIALRKLTACLAEARPRWGRQTLAKPYLSKEQEGDLGQALMGKDTCTGGPEAEFRFRASGIVGSLAEHYLEADIERADGPRLSQALSTLTPLNVSEDFALCVAARNPAAARDLALSEPGSAAEEQAVAKLAGAVEPCTNDGEALTVDLQSLRALTSTALYRGVTAVLTQ